MSEYGRLTQSDVVMMTAPFPAGDHEFNRGFIYISEEAICARLDSVDSSWEWRVTEMIYENDMATVTGVLIVNGVKRYGVGQQLAQIDGKGKESVGESRKGAATDAMKRAARLFGIGRYLLQCPKDVKGPGQDLNKWLASMAKQGPKQSVSKEAEPSTPAPHWSMIDADMESLYTRAFDTHNLKVQDVQALIAASGKPILSLSKADAWALVSKGAKKAAN